MQKNDQLLFCFEYGKAYDYKDHDEAERKTTTLKRCARPSER